MVLKKWNVEKINFIVYDFNDFNEKNLMLHIKFENLLDFIKYFLLLGMYNIFCKKKKFEHYKMLKNIFESLWVFTSV